MNKKLLIFLMTLVPASALGLSACGSNSKPNPETPEQPVEHEHRYSSSVTKAATCTETGVTTYKCLYCTESYTEVIPALGHNLSQHAAQTANCTQIGWAAYEDCSRCDYTTYKEIPKTGHNFVNFECTVCGTPDPNTPATDGLVYTEIKSGGQTVGYTISGSGVIKESNLVIPDTHNGLPVMQIGGSAFMNKASFTSITIPDTVTQIGASAFSGCTALRTVVLGSGLTSIGYAAFNGCTSLTGIDIPAEVDTIGNNAFNGCTSLTSVSFESGSKLTAIGDRTFFNSGVSQIAIPARVNKIGNYAFSGCSHLSDLSFDGNELTSIGNYAFYGCSSLLTLSVPSGVEEIGSNAFNGCNSLMSITLPFAGAKLEGNANTHFGYIFGATGYSDNAARIPSSLKSVTLSSAQTVADNAFNKCDSLTEITFGDSLTSIGTNAFAGCTSITAVALPAEVTSVGTGAFSGCTSLLTVTTANGSKLTSIGDSAFYGCTALSGITFGTGSTLDSIGNSAFNGCENLLSVSVPDTVTSIGTNAFTGCNHLVRISLPFVGASNISNHTHFGYIFGASSYSTNSSAVPETLKTVTVTGGDIANYAFNGCDNITEVITTGVNSIGYQAFNNCSKLETLTIGEGVTSINNRAFSNCEKLVSVTFNAKECISAGSGGQHIFENSNNINTINIGNGVTSIPSYTFAGCPSVTGITIPDSVTSIGYAAFEHVDKLERLSVPFTGSGQNSENAHLGYIFGANGYAQNSECVPATLTSVEITGGQKIEDNAFYGCTNINSVTFTGNITEIGNSAFEGCSNISRMSLPSTLVNIGERSFYGSGLTEINFPASVKNIGNNAFGGCRSMLSMTFAAGSGLEKIGDSAFRGAAVSSIELPASVSSIGANAFSGCTGIQSITITENVLEIGGGAFDGCTGLSEIIWDAKACTTAGTEANPVFKGCTGEIALSISESVTEIPDNAFSGCTHLTEIVVPDSVTSIGKGAFANCSGLQKIDLPFTGASADGNENTIFGYVFGATRREENSSRVPKSLKTVVIRKGSTIADDTFYGCSGIQTVDLPADVTAIGGYAFDGCTSLEYVNTAENNAIVSIGDYAFVNCSSLKSVSHLEDSALALLGNRAFYGCASLESLPLDNAELNTIGDRAFYGCTGLQRVIFGEKNTFDSIGTEMFSGCVKLEEVAIPSSVTTIGNSAFLNCIELKEITLPANLASIGMFAFKNSGLESVEVPSKVHEIGYDAFGGCESLASATLPFVGNLLTATVDKNNLGYIFGAIDYTTNTEKVPAALTSVNITGGTVIAANAFKGLTQITDIQIGGSIMTINASAFEDCTGLISVTFEDGSDLDKIDNSAFINCSALPEIVLPDKVTTIGDSAFYGCVKLGGIDIPNSVTSIGESAFENCEKLATVRFNANDSSTSIGVQAFKGCGVQRLEFASSVASIGESAFEDCVNLASVKVGADSLLETIGDNAFKNCEILASVVFDGSSKLTSIGVSAFENCPELETVTLSEQNGETTIISEKAFYQDAKLLSLIIPESVTSIGESAFEGCDSLGNVEFAEDSKLESIGKKAFIGNPFTEIIIPEGVTSIGVSAFENCSNLEHISLPFAGDGKTYTHFGYVFGAGSYTANSVNVPETLTSVKLTGGALIDNNSFKGLTNIVNLEISNATEQIGESAFFGCSALQSVTFDDGSVLESIGVSAFEGCGELLEITIPNGVTSIGNRAFINNAKLRSVTFGTVIPDPEPETQSGTSVLLETIGASAFFGCVKLESIEIPDGVTEIGANAFEGCEELAAVTVTDDSALNSIGDRAFFGCINFTEINLPADLKTIGENAFGNSAKLATVKWNPTEATKTGTAAKPIFAGTAITSITIGEDVVSIPDYAFLGCDVVESVAIPDNIVKIGNEAFKGCLKLADVQINGNAKLTTIGTNSFNGCTDLTSIVIPENVTSIGASAFAGGGLTDVDWFATAYTVDCPTASIFGTALTTVKVEANVTTLPAYIFYKAANLSSVTFENDEGATELKSIGVSAFEGCGSLTEISLPESLTTIGATSFKSSALTSITIPENVTAINTYAFQSCTSLATVNWNGKTVATAGTAANPIFSGCTALTTVNVGDNVTALPAYSFHSATKLTNVVFNKDDAGNTAIMTINAQAFQNCSSLTEIEIPSSVTSIGATAFGGCSKLESITLPFVGGAASSNTYFGYIFGSTSATNQTGVPATLTTVEITGAIAIAGNAFYGCNKIQNISIDNVTSIGTSSFQNCSALTGITIPEGIATVSASAFYGCSALKDVTLPDSLTSIGNSAFLGCAITEITIPAKVQTIDQSAFNANRALETITFEKSEENTTALKTIGVSAFNGCTKLVNITLPDSLTTIGNTAFVGCAITEVTLPEGLTSIGTYAFQNCTLLATVNWNAKNLSSVGSAANPIFGGCTSLATANIGKEVTTIPSFAFHSATKLTDVVFEENEDGETAIKTINAQAFQNCSSLTEIEIPSSVTTIGSTVFGGCSKLESITLPFVGGTASSNTYFGYIFGSTSATNQTGVPATLTTVEITGAIAIAGNAFYGCNKIQNISIDNATSIGTSSFYNCSALTEIEIPSSVTAIGNTAFYNCSTLTEIEIPDSVNTIGSQAFYGCSGLKRITLPFVGNSKTAASPSTSTLFGYIFGGPNNASFAAAVQRYNPSNTNTTTTYYLPAGLTEVTITGGNILFGAFSGCGNLVHVTLPSDLKAISDYTFYNCSSLSFNGEDETILSLPSTLTSIGNYAFGGSTNMGLTKIEIPASVTTIGNYAFTNCSLEKVVFETGSLLESLGGHAFENCKALPDITIPSGVTAINDNTFKGCTALTGVTIPATLTAIGTSAFEGCIVLETLTLPANLVTIGGSAFKGCTDLTGVSMPDKVQTIGASAFEGCTDFTVTITEDSELTSIGDSAFKGCAIDTILLPSGVKSIGNSVFESCASLYSIDIRGDLSSIGNSAFSGCTALTGITLPATLTSIGDYAFKGCNKFTTLVIPANVTTIGTAALSGCSALTELTIPFVGNSKTASTASANTLFGYLFGTEQFDGATSTTQNHSATATAKYYTPDGLTKVTVTGGNLLYGAFSGCDKLVTVSLSSIPSIPENCFAGCAALSSVTLPDGATAIKASAFKGCALITSIAIPDSVTEIGASAFEDCTNLTLTIEASSELKTIGNKAFKGCEKLTEINLPEGLTSIGDNAFDGCITLDEIELPEGLTSIGAEAFKDCVLFTSLEIPSTVTSIGAKALSGCVLLTELTIPFVGDGKTATASDKTTFGYLFGTEQIEGTTVVNQYYTDTKSITVYIPDGLATVTVTGGALYRGAFYGCTTLTTVNLPDNLTVIPDNCFYGCTALTGITIPDTVTTIGAGAFMNCTGSAFTEVVLPDSVTSIKESAFKNCQNLTGISIPDGITEIGTDAFAGCDLTYYGDDYAKYLGNNIHNYLVLVSIDALDSIGEEDEPVTIDQIIVYAETKLVYGNPFADCDSVEKVYFKGNNAEWTASPVKALLPDGFNLYYYAEEQPEEAGQFWHYRDDEKTPEAWPTLSDYDDTYANYIGTEKNNYLELISLKDGVIDGNGVIESIVLYKGTNRIKDGAFESCESIQTVYFYGTAEDWENYSADVKSLLTEDSKVYFYYADETAEYFVNPDDDYKLLIRVKAESIELDSQTKLCGNPFEGCDGITVYFIGDESKWNDYSEKDSLTDLTVYCYYVKDGCTYFGSVDAETHEEKFEILVSVPADTESIELDSNTKLYGNPFEDCGNITIYFNGDKDEWNAYSAKDSLADETVYCNYVKDGCTYFGSVNATTDAEKYEILVSVPENTESIELNSQTKLRGNPFENCNGITIYFDGDKMDWTAYSEKVSSLLPADASIYCHYENAENNCTYFGSIDAETDEDKFELLVSVPADIESLELDSETQLYGNPFANCTSATAIYFNGTADGWKDYTAEIEDEINATIYCKYEEGNCTYFGTDTTNYAILVGVKEDADSIELNKNTVSLYNGTIENIENVDTVYFTGTAAEWKDYLKDYTEVKTALDAKTVYCYYTYGNLRYFGAGNNKYEKLVEVIDSSEDIVFNFTPTSVYGNGDSLKAYTGNVYFGGTSAQWADHVANDLLTEATVYCRYEDETFTYYGTTDNTDAKIVGVKSGITTIELEPASVLYHDPFANSTSLTTVNFNGTVAEWSAYLEEYPSAKATLESLTVYCTNESNQKILVSLKDGATIELDNSTVISGDPFAACKSTATAVYFKGTAADWTAYLANYADAKTSLEKLTVYCTNDGSQVLVSVKDGANIVIDGTSEFSGNPFENCTSATTIFYYGTKDEWNTYLDNLDEGELKESLKKLTVYYYSETKPTETGYWHYLSNNTPSA